ncbi:uncharacterized protein [Nicotiana tomentosiformis]|uniref:uncharacterized protein n=1 Tax=Nicotiana tomentosiformis TaxID=4098 RepID=UPI00388C935C
MDNLSLKHVKCKAHNANFLASEGLQRLIREKEELSSKRDQLLAERDQTVLCLLELETRATEANVFGSPFARSVKAKWVEVQNAILAANDREAAATKRITNLEATLNSKAEELAVAGARHARLEEKYKKIIEHNRLYSSTVHDLDVNLRSARSARDNLSAEITQLKEELRRREASIVVEKTYSMYNMRRKTLEGAKAGVFDIGAEIAKSASLS